MKERYLSRLIKKDFAKGTIKNTARIIAIVIFAYGRMTGQPDSELRLGDYGRLTEMQQKAGISYQSDIHGQSASHNYSDSPNPSSHGDGDGKTPDPLTDAILRKIEQMKKKEEEESS